MSQGPYIINKDSEQARFDNSICQQTDAVALTAIATITPYNGRKLTGFKLHLEYETKAHAITHAKLL
jgi:hypothetical protein